MLNSLQSRRTKSLISPASLSLSGIVLLVLVLGFSFYWFQLRPIRLYRQCTQQSSVDARKLLTSKADIAKGTSLGNEYNNLLQKNMYLRSDYDSFLKKCLLYYGMNSAAQTATSTSTK